MARRPQVSRTALNWHPRDDWRGSCRSIHNELATLKHHVEHERSKLEEKERELASVTEDIIAYNP